MVDVVRMEAQLDVVSFGRIGGGQAVRDGGLNCEGAVN